MGFTPQDSPLAVPRMANPFYALIITPDITPRFYAIRRVIVWERFAIVSREGGSSVRAAREIIVCTGEIVVGDGQFAGFIDNRFSLALEHKARASHT